MPGATFVLQGHRGARGLKPENTLPSFEAALDCGVTSIETDLHLTRDGHVVLAHDAQITDRLYRPLGRVQADLPPAASLEISRMSLAELRNYVADRNPDPLRFPTQKATATPLATAVALRTAIHPFAPPTLDDFFAFVDSYAGAQGEAAGKTAWQQARARSLIFDLELKRVPFRPERMGDVLDASGLGKLEECVLAAIRRCQLADRVVVRSFDHRCVRAIKGHEPSLTAAILIAGTAPVAPEALAQAAGATWYCPEVEFLDQVQVKRLQEYNLRVVPWTVNDRGDWDRLLDWGVDGITTDYPDRLALRLNERGVLFGQDADGTAS